ncbi:MAG TPA: carboxypeptidase regulatory-like domain-containing protein [Herpetosiphonaceae bacterium]|nr:carboxypeptidase regulatory-like domain-containing protein [Herpetosiphonaceae bacterium]
MATARRLRRKGRQVRRLLLVSLLALIAFLSLSNDERIWPYRNTLHYHLLQAWWSVVPAPEAQEHGEIAGVVRAPDGAPIEGARVLVSAHDGTAWSDESDGAGKYRIAGIPPARYVPVAGAEGFENVALRRLGWFRTLVSSGRTTQLDVTLPRMEDRALAPAKNFRLDPPRTLTIEKPLPATAEERAIHFEVDGRPNQLSLYYTPVGGESHLPTLLAVYPGPADTWAQVSLPLAQAGYAVIAVGPAYALDLEPDIDDLRRLLDALEAGAFPRADPTRLAALGGSYSGAHVFRLLQRYPAGLDALLLLGAPTDLFELRRLFEEGSFFPPFDLDKALVALGLPDGDPEIYWRYSPIYHAHSYNVPIMLIHSKVDEVVPFTQSERLSGELKRLGKRHELYILEGMGHYLLEPERTPAVDDLFRITTEFFARELDVP